MIMKGWMDYPRSKPAYYLNPDRLNHWMFGGYIVDKTIFLILIL